MELVLTGGMMTAKEAEIAGLVARVVPNDKVLLILSYLLMSSLLFPVHLFSSPFLFDIRDHLHLDL